MWESRLERLPRIAAPGGVCLVVADRPSARVAGLAALKVMPPRTALLIPGCRSVHTFGMRFALDLIWLGDDDVRIVDVNALVEPWRVVSRANARAVVECSAGTGAEFFTALATAPSGSIPTRRRPR